MLQVLVLLGLLNGYDYDTQIKDGCTSWVGICGHLMGPLMHILLLLSVYGVAALLLGSVTRSSQNFFFCFYVCISYPLSF